jgi:RecJ-like exonuclease
MTGGGAVVTSFPTIVEFLGTHDSGPTDGGRDCSTCPHCGSKGRYTHYFRCDDGNSYGAMSGCIKLFPISEIAQHQKRLMDKLREKQAKGWKLNRGEQAQADAIQAYYNGEISEDEALRTVRREQAALTAYYSKKYGRR